MVRFYLFWVFPVFALIVDAEPASACSDAGPPRLECAGEEPESIVCGYNADCPTGSQCQWNDRCGCGCSWGEICDDVGCRCNVREFDVPEGCWVQETPPGGACEPYRHVQCFEYDQCGDTSTCDEAPACEVVICALDVCIGGALDGEPVPCQNGICTCLPPPPGGASDGCGCVAGGRPSGGLLAIGLALFFVHRRQR